MLPRPSPEEVAVFADMFELFPIYSTLDQLPPITMIELLDGTYIHSTWESHLLCDKHFLKGAGHGKSI